MSLYQISPLDNPGEHRYFPTCAKSWQAEVLQEGAWLLPAKSVQEKGECSKCQNIKIATMLKVAARYGNAKMDDGKLVILFSSKSEPKFAGTVRSRLTSMPAH